jgi:hypothetical protein
MCLQCGCVRVYRLCNLIMTIWVVGSYVSHSRDRALVRVQVQVQFQCRESTDNLNARRMESNKEC